MHLVYPSAGTRLGILYNVLDSNPQPLGSATSINRRNCFAAIFWNPTSIFGSRIASLPGPVELEQRDTAYPSVDLRTSERMRSRIERMPALPLIFTITMC